MSLRDPGGCAAWATRATGAAEGVSASTEGARGRDEARVATGDGSGTVAMRIGPGVGAAERTYPGVPSVVAAGAGGT